MSSRVSCVHRRVRLVVRAAARPRGDVPWKLRGEDLDLGSEVKGSEVTGSEVTGFNRSECDSVWVSSPEVRGRVT